MQNQITLQELAEKIGGNYWEKGDLRRIYLQKGYNTKKMSTKTFVWQDENGEFKVSCKVDCPSQPWQWCKSQEDEVKEGVYEDIENALSEKVFIMVNSDGKPTDTFGKEVPLTECEYHHSETRAKKEIDNCADYHSYITMDREEFESEIKRLKEVSAQSPKEVITTDARVKHAKFGAGTVVSVDAEKIKVLFDDEVVGQKEFVAKFIKLEIIN